MVRYLGMGVHVKESLSKCRTNLLKDTRISEPFLCRETVQCNLRRQVTEIGERNFSNKIRIFLFSLFVITLAQLAVARGGCGDET